jgi:hypothetical protein
MCLGIVYRGKEKKDALAKLPKSGYYWKLVVLFDNKYIPPIFSEYGSYKNGWNSTHQKSECAGYFLAYHLFRYKKDAKKMMYWVSAFKKKKVIVRCKVRKKDIINIGRQDMGLTIVTTRFWMPKLKKRPA